MTLAERARAVERDILGALIGALVALGICRLAVFVMDIHLYALIATILIGSWSGAFVAHLGVDRFLPAIESMRSVAAAFRAIVLRAILWLLGIASVLGVLAVLTGSFEVVGRVAATAGVTALATCLLWPFLLLFDQDKNWRVGLFGTVSVITAYILGMPSIWQFGYRPEEAALSSVTVALMMPVGLIAMFLSHSQITRIAGFLGILLYTVATACFLLAIWAADDWRSSGKLVETAFITLAFGALAIVTTVNAATGDRRYWRWIGFLAAGLAGTMCFHGVWTNDWVSAESIITVISVAVVIAHANLAILAPLKSGQTWWRYATIVAATITAVALDAELWLDPGPSRGLSMLGRISLASGILASTGTLALLILTRLNRPGEEAAVPSGPITSIDLRCPKCSKMLTMPLGTSACPACGLVFTLEVGEGQEAVGDRV